MSSPCASAVTCTYNRCRDTFGAADFVATTLVVASNHVKGMSKPDLMFFDESPYTHELYSLIAIANSNPMV
jgi:regulator of nonsense transcripts 1